MGKFQSELTRRYLLNSNSRGSLEEVASEDDSVEFGEEEDYLSDSEPMGNDRFMKQWDGRDTTHAYFRQSYE